MVHHGRAGQDRANIEQLVEIPIESASDQRVIASLVVVDARESEGLER